MANSYKPKVVSIASIDPNKNPLADKKLTTTLWSHILINGTAKLSNNGQAVSNAAVLVWYLSDANKASFGNVDNATFTDINGKYAITVPTKTKLTVRVYN